MQSLSVPSPSPPVLTSRERAVANKKAQEEALARISPNTLYIALWIRSDPPQADDFHWGYYFHTDSSGGIQYHVKGLNAGWITDHGREGGIFKSNFLCVLIQIATIPAVKHRQLDQIMRSRDADLNSIPNVTCRVWLTTILGQMIEHGLVRCSRVDALERECKDFGNQYSGGAQRNEQPRPVVTSRLCT
ncbi:uncharacterized protein BP01DRAFT_87927 [Aspergillus saccharolyticus JOP 1030-1]|uniref:Uncharacterized protein n=1 Tax=Aspergillus saccharolyticus JOP 1030-1 TaxID=1450539 RepID=A0A318ZBZ5_9EURO|nr:hypothetical protein BP01DRAFT_87927 [Aspergillus saccharolyticus JOP 1030-1]PYH44047.1 hypothetical protein BP01DRAFT_87927 [Aspergillus saccharolyticus JOP 1030-1]